MKALVSSELLKLRTTRVRWAYMGTVVAIAGIAAAGMIGSAARAERGTAPFQAGLLDAALVASLVALMVGITIVAGEFRHGTITPTLLVAPVRARVLAAKGVAAVLGGVSLALAAIVVAVLVAVVWLTASGADLHLHDASVWHRALQALLAGAVWALFGAALGSVVHSQIGAIVGALVWLLLVESLVAALLALAGWEGAADYLPAQVLGAVDTGHEGGLDYGPALGVAFAYIAALGALGVLRTGRRDIT